MPNLNPRVGPLLLVLVAIVAGGLAQGARALSTSVDFSSPPAVLSLGRALAPYHAANGNESEGSRWYMMTAANGSVRPVTRVLAIEQPYDSGLRLLPRRNRAAIRQVATSDADVLVENAHAYGRYAFRITIPPATSAELAMRISDANPQPRVSAWLEPALAAHNQQLAVLFAAVAGLVAAAFAIMTGLAAMTGHAAPRWAAVVLLGVLLVHLSTAGLFDAVGEGGVGGPFGITAMLAGLTLAAGFRLADTIAPADKIWGAATLRWVIIVLVGVSAFAVVGVPGAMLVANIAVLLGTALIAAHLVHEGLCGAQGARVAAPSATIFALVTTAAAVWALGGLQSNQSAPGIIGGFAATGAVLLALAIAAGEGIAIIPARSSTPPAERAKLRPALRDDIIQALTAIGASYQGVFEVDLVRDSVKLSPEAAALIGLPKGADTFSSEAWLARLHPDDRDVYQDAIDRFSGQKGLAFRVEFRARTDSGSYCWLELRATAMGEGEAVERYLGLIADVTTRKEADVPLGASDRDTLTGLRNRTGLIEELDQQGEGLSSVTLALLDIDRFKSVHASFGDAGGDSVLVGIAERLAALCRGRASLFRIGGDSFALLFSRPDMNALAIGERIVEALNSPHSWKGRNAFAPASVGVALGRDARDGSELIRHAELALSRAKREGGACTRLYGRELEKSAPADGVALDAELRRSFAQGEIELVYQPIMRLGDGSIAGFEALLRWNHPERGVITPAEFISHAEQTGFIVELGRFALSRAAGDLGRWQKMFPLDPPLFVSANVSRRQLNDRDLEKTIARLLATSGVMPGTLKLELTESTASAGAGTLETLERLRGCGASLAIDDFGTGASTLSQLRNAPFDTVKIDKSFLARAEDDEGRGLLRSIVNLTHELGRVVVLEGVESEQDALWLKEMGCEFAQGFYFAPPLARNDIPVFIARHRMTAAAGQAELGMARVRGEA